jgi:hypothetical protein
MLKTKEHLLHYFLNQQIKLSTYDQKFLHNLEYLIAKYHRVTSNQQALFEKLISKYAKQFTKVGFVKEELKSLPWTTPIVESTPEFTGAQVSRFGNEIILKVPFNKHFISDFRSTDNNSYEWNRDSKHYVSPLTTNALRLVNNVLPKYFNTVVYNVEIMELLNQVISYEAKFWDPTYVKLNGNYYVVAMNSFLSEAINNIVLDDHPKSLFLLSQHGIKIDESVTQNDPKKLFASNFSPVIDLDNFHTVAEWLRELNIDLVYFGRGLGNTTTRNEITAILKQLNIQVANNSRFYTEDDAKTPVMLKLVSGTDYLPSYYNKRLAKIIQLQISRPVPLK